jgi:hypothetical protein
LSAAVAALAVLVSCRPPATPSPAFPAPLATFLAAYVRGDEATAEAAASPLYGAEWARRGLTAADRAGLAPGAHLRDRSGAWARFVYVGAAEGGDGYGHHLLVAWPARPPVGERPLPSVWRVDTAPDGRVIWLELVWLCAAGASRLTPAAGDPDAPTGPVPGLPAAVAALHPRALVGVRSDVGREGYYALGPAAGADGAAPAARDGSHPAVLFVGVDPEGVVRPGAWSYGQRVVGPSEYGTPPGVSAGAGYASATAPDARVGA